MAAVGTVVTFVRAPLGEEFDALVLSGEGPGFVKVVYVDTTVNPAVVTTTSAVPVATPNAVGLVIE